jgi:hypothetical protein
MVFSCSKVCSLLSQASLPSRISKCSNFSISQLQIEVYDEIRMVEGIHAPSLTQYINFQTSVRSLVSPRHKCSQCHPWHQYALSLLEKTSFYGKMECFIDRDIASTKCWCLLIDCLQQEVLNEGDEKVWITDSLNSSSLITSSVPGSNLNWPNPLVIYT